MNRRRHKGPPIGERRWTIFHVIRYRPDGSAAYVERPCEVRVLSRPDHRDVVRVEMADGSHEEVHALWFEEAEKILAKTKV